MNIYVIFSGLVGAVLGGVIVVGVYWHSRYSSTKRALADRLEILRHDVYWHCSDSEAFKAWDTSLKEIWALYNSFFDFVPFWQKSRVQNAWGKYKGIDHDIKNNFKHGFFDSKKGPKNKQEFLQNITSFIDAL